MSKFDLIVILDVCHTGRDLTNTAFCLGEVKTRELLRQNYPHVLKAWTWKYLWEQTKENCRNITKVQKEHRYHQDWSTNMRYPCMSMDQQREFKYWVGCVWSGPRSISDFLYSIQRSCDPGDILVEWRDKCTEKDVTQVFMDFNPSVDLSHTTHAQEEAHSFGAQFHRHSMGLDLYMQLRTENAVLYASKVRRRLEKEGLPLDDENLVEQRMFLFLRRT